jgi:hypothetical protein
MSLDELEKSDAGGEKGVGGRQASLGGSCEYIEGDRRAFLPRKRRYEPVESLPSPSINKVPEEFLTESSVFPAVAVSKVANPYRPQASYADFVLLRVLEFCKRAGDDILVCIVASEPAFQMLCEASRKWLMRDDH